MQGLTLEDWGTLNRCFKRKELLNSMRKKYKNNPYALEQLDIFDKDSPYKIHFRIFKNAFWKTKDESVVKKELKWLAENYPLIEKYGAGNP